MTMRFLALGWAGLVAAWLLPLAPACAAIQTKSLVGLVQTVSDIGLTIAPGDAVRTRLTWDDTQIRRPDAFTPRGIEGFLPLNGSAGTLRIELGGLVVDETADFDFRGGSFPRLNFVGSEPVGIDIVTRSQFLFGSAIRLALSVDTSSFLFTVVDRGGVTHVTGTLRFVPLPGALPLLASGLLLAAVFRRVTRRR